MARTSVPPASTTQAGTTPDPAPPAARTFAGRINEALDRGDARDAAERLAATWTKELPR